VEITIGFMILVAIASCLLIIYGYIEEFKRDPKSFLACFGIWVVILTVSYFIGRIILR